MLSVLILTAALAADPIVIEEAQVTIASQVQVPARESGTLEELSVVEGDLVEKGQLLGRIDGTLAAIEREAAAIEHDIAGYQSENDVDPKKVRELLAKEISQWFDQNKHRFPEWRPGDALPEIEDDTKNGALEESDD